MSQRNKESRDRAAGFRGNQEPVVEPGTESTQAHAREPGPDRSTLAREEAAQLRQAEAAVKDTNARQLGGAIGNTNQAQVDRRNAIADNLDKTPERAAMAEVSDEEILTPVESDAERIEREAAEAEVSAETERARLEASGGEVPITDPDEAVVSPRKFKLKVNGKEVELTEEELIEKAQKVASGDEYLQIAAKAVERTQPAKPPDSDASPSVGDADIEDTLTSALMGDKEAIKTIARRLKAPPAVTPDVLSAVDDRLSFRSAADWFKGEYEDLVTDPMLYRLVKDEDARIAKENPNVPYRERLKSVGEKIRAWKTGLAPAPTPPNPKLTRKASVAPVPQAGGRQVAPSEEEEETESLESVIDKMARSRHQVGAIRKPQ